MITIFNLAQKGKMAFETTMLTWELTRPKIKLQDFYNDLHLLLRN